MFSHTLVRDVLGYYLGYKEQCYGSLAYNHERSLSLWTLLSFLSTLDLLLSAC